MLAASLNLNYAIAQNRSEITRLEVQAKENYENYKYFTALNLYKKLDSLNKNLPLYKFRIAACYFNMGKDEEALPFFEECLKTPLVHPQTLNFYLAKCYHFAHRFDKAIEFYEKYKSHLKQTKDDKSPKAIESVNREIAMCNTGKHMMSQKSNIKVTNLGKNINSIYPDYGPVISADESVLIFSSCRPDTKGGLYEELDGLYHEDIYISYKSDSGWTKPTNLQDINTDGNDAAISLSPDGHTLLLYRHNLDNPELENSGDLYKSEFKAGKWINPIKLDNKINSNAYEPSATITGDERQMIFASDRKGGFGGTDLYLIKKGLDGKWLNPINLGNKINSIYDEDSPFLHPDGKTLYFSSKGHEGMGGYDIFYSKYDETKKEWTSPENIGYPISTAHDDLYFCWSANGKKAYFSSIRPEGVGDKDIYVAETPEEVSSELVVMTGLITDSLTSTPIEAYITIKDKVSNEVIGIFNSEAGTGKYLLVFPEGSQYKLEINAENYQLCTDIFDYSNIKEYKEVNKNIKLCKMQR